MNIKKMTAILLSSAMLIGGGAVPQITQTAFTALTANAASIIDSGELEAGFVWTLDSEGTLTVTGEGDMFDYDYNAGPGGYYSPLYGDKIKSIVISDGITSIGDGTFGGNTELVSITIPDSVTRIGGGAFSYSPKLTSVAIPDSVKEIGEYAFSDCEKLETVELPSSVEEIGYQAFLSTPWLSKMTEESDMFIVNDILLDANKCTGDVVIPDNVKSIAGGAFRDCGENLTSVTIPDSVKSIGDYAFMRCVALTSITIPDSVTSIGNGVFGDCSALESVTIPASVTSIGNYAFDGTKWLEEMRAENKFVIVNGTLIASQELSGDVVIPEGVTTITNGGIVKNGMESNIEALTLPTSVTQLMADDEWEYFTKLTAINVAEENKNFSSADGVLFNKDKTELISYPAARAAEEYTIPDTVKTINSYSFADSTNLKKLIMPDSVEKIERFAFRSSSVEAVSLSKSLTEIGDWTFIFSSLKNITIPNNITRIGQSAFGACAALESVRLPDTLTELAIDAFNDCPNLTSINIPKSLTVINPGVFSYCTRLESISLPDTITSIGYLSFGECKKLSSIDIPASVETIDEYAFNNCESLKFITIKNPDCEIYDDEKTISNSSKWVEDHDEAVFDGVIRGYKGSTAEAYAKKYNRKFEALSTKAAAFGDPNKDGFVNAKDASFVLGIYAQLSTGNTVYLDDDVSAACDVKTDGKIDAKDATIMLSYYSYLSTGGKRSLEDFIAYGDDKEQA